MVGRGGFKPPKAEPTDLQSVPFGRSGTSPNGADDRSRTCDLLITSQLLYQLSYVGKYACEPPTRFHCPPQLPSAPIHRLAINGAPSGTPRQQRSPIKNS